MQGVTHHLDYLSFNQQKALLEALQQAIKAAPFYCPSMPKTGQPFSVLETNLGPLGWVSDKAGYRYQPHHPFTGKPWPSMPEMLVNLWHDLTGYPHPPEAALLNYYTPAARMGLHQDRDEETFDAPVLSLSLGLSARFRIGGTTRQSPTISLRLNSGDVLCFGGPARLAFHGIDRILKTLPKGREHEVSLIAEKVSELAKMRSPGSLSAKPDAWQEASEPPDVCSRPGRLNITLRRVHAP